jgi:tRNA U34 5-methylaminomethyl-2-thiouridine-forming methyltransferase MnmC
MPEIATPHPLQIIQTADGSPTLFNQNLGETYHSRHGAIQESEHVFIAAGLEHWRKQHIGTCRLLEIGFGTGLNAALALAYGQEHAMALIYTTLEKYPLPNQLLQQLVPLLPTALHELWHQVHAAPWNVLTSIGNQFQFQKLEGDVHDLSFPSTDVLFFDAFAPEVVPSQWTEALMQKCFQCLHPGGVLVTYCAKGSVRRTLQSVGFTIERIPGPPGKREMLRATKPVTPHA